jgi:hypothetical protein
MTSIVSVLRSGGDFGPEDVRRLAIGVKARHPETRFVCLTDQPRAAFDAGLVDDVIPLARRWPSWWSKMELFSIEGPAVYLDLDTIVMGPIDSLLHWPRFNRCGLMMLRGFYLGDYCSGVMAWGGSRRALFDEFSREADEKNAFATTGMATIFRNRKRTYRGDQDWIKERVKELGVPVILAQDVMPGIYSYKVDIQKANAMPSDARLVCFHGKPRPSEVNLGALRRVPSVL